MPGAEPTRATVEILEIICSSEKGNSPKFQGICWRLKKALLIFLILNFKKWTEVIFFYFRFLRGSTSKIGYNDFLLNAESLLVVFAAMLCAVESFQFNCNVESLRLCSITWGSTLGWRMSPLWKLSPTIKLDTPVSTVGCHHRHGHRHHNHSYHSQHHHRHLYNHHYLHHHPHHYGNRHIQ